MTDRSSLRLVVLQVLVISLLLTLVGRLWYMQVIATTTYQAIAANNAEETVVTPAVRGLILDDKGRPLAENRESIVVTVDAETLAGRKDKGKVVLDRLAKVLGTTYRDLYERTRRCGTDPDAHAPECWSGSPFQPIPVAKDVTTQVALSVSEERERFPGVSATLETVREYPEPLGANAAHELGYLGPATQAEINASKGTSSPITASDLVGKTGLEAVYDNVLRGKAGVTTYYVNAARHITGTESDVAATPGDYLVTSLDAQVQKVAEDQLAAAIKRARVTGDVNKKGKKFPADSGAVVVMDVRTGRIIAMASYPTYNPSVWVGGISAKDYAAITSKKDNYPTLSRAYQGLYAPGSTFKVVSLPAVAKSPGYSLYGSYPCPSKLKIGNTYKANYESEAFGNISLQKAIEVSCDTVFYGVAYHDWLHEGGAKAKLSAKDPFTEMAKAYGMDELTGVDLTGEARSRIFDRQGKYQYWQATRASACEGAKTRPKGTYLQRIDAENCSAQGYIYLPGDAANFAIGQGSTAVTPLQMARAYAAVANGGTLWQPTIGKAVITPSGKLVRIIKPKKVGRLPVPKTVLAYLQHALTTVVTGSHGTARGPFANFPKGQLPIAAKTGTAEVQGKATTSWFASYAPANKPQYAVVMMVSQGGTGSGISGPSVEKIYEALYGVTGSHTVDPAKAIMTTPPTTLPRITKNGRLVAVPTLPLLKTWVPNLTGIPGPPLYVATAADSRARATGRAARRANGSTASTRASPSRSP